MMNQYNYYLLLGGAVSFLIALLHILLVVGVMHLLGCMTQSGSLCSKPAIILNVPFLSECRKVVENNIG